MKISLQMKGQTDENIRNHSPKGKHHSNILD